MRIPREFIRNLVDRADVAEVVGERVQLRRRGGNFFGLCPFHTEKTPSFSVNPERGFYHCFGCGAHGTALDFIVKTECAGDFIAGVESLAKRMNMTIPRESGGDDSGDKMRGDLSALLHAAMGRWRRLLAETPKARDYLKGRGMTGETAKKFSLGYAADDWRGLDGFLPDYNSEAVLRAGLAREKDGRRYDYFRGRVMFPILSAPERVVGFGGRALGDDEPKYLNSPDSPLFAKGRNLFGLPQASDAARRRNRLIVCEGYMDVVMLSQAGFEESVAAMGTAFTAAQMEKAARAAKNIIFAFDGDDAGKHAASRTAVAILPALRDGMGVSFLFLPKGEDPDSYVQRHGAAAFETMLTNATPLVRFLTDHFWESAKVGTDEGQKSAAASQGAKALGQLRGEEKSEAPPPTPAFRRLSGQRGEGQRESTQPASEGRVDYSRLVRRDKAPFLRELLKRSLADKTDASKEMLEEHSRLPARARTPDNAVFQHGFRMRPEGLLFRLLSCLAAKPALAADLEETPPLIGAPGEPELVDMVLSRLRFHDARINVPEWLESKGYALVAEQLRYGTLWRFARIGEDPTGEFNSVLRALERRHLEKTGAGQKAWLEKVNAGPEDDYDIPPLDAD